MLVNTINMCIHGLQQPQGLYPAAIASSLRLKVAVQELQL